MAGRSPARSARRVASRPAADESQGGSDDGRTGAALRRPQSEQHGRPPSGGAARAQPRTSRKGEERREGATPRRGQRTHPRSRRRDGIRGRRSYAVGSAGGRLLRSRQDRHRPELGAGLRPAALPGGPPVPLGAAPERLRPGPLPAAGRRRGPDGPGPRLDALAHPGLGTGPGDRHRPGHLREGASPRSSTPRRWSSSTSTATPGRKSSSSRPHRSRSSSHLAEHLGVDECIASRSAHRRRRPLHRRARVLRLRARTRPRPSARPPTRAASTWPAPTPTPTRSPTPRCWSSSAIRWRSTPTGSWPASPASGMGDPPVRPARPPPAAGPDPAPGRTTAAVGGVLAALGLGVAG